MEEYPRNTLEFERRFATEEACRHYLAELRWPGEHECPRCGCAEAWMTQRGLYRCSRCDLQTSVTAGTIFEGTRKPLHVWFRAMWYVVGQKQGVSALGLQRILGLNRYETVWVWLHKLRRAMVRPGRDRLSGVLEVDETYIGGKKPGKRGRGAGGKSLVVIVAQEDGKRIGRIRLQRVADGSAPSLEAAVQSSVEPGSVIRTDGWMGYNGLGKLGYVHRVVRQEGRRWREPLALGQQGRVAAQTLVVGNPSGCCSLLTPGLLS